MFNNYSQINEPVYNLSNGTLRERFQFKSFQQENVLGVIEGKEFKWKNDMERDFLERRGNLGNITLRGMTEAYDTANIFIKDWKKFARISNDISEAYEVSNFCRWWFKFLHYFNTYSKHICIRNKKFYRQE